MMQYDIYAIRNKRVNFFDIEYILLNSQQNFMIG